MRSKVRSDSNWWFIEAKDDSRRGYWPGMTKEEACSGFGLKVVECSVRRVIRTEEGFIEINHIEQGKLL